MTSTDELGRSTEGNRVSQPTRPNVTPSRARHLLQLFRAQGLFLILAGLVVTFGLLSPYFLHVGNLLNIGSGVAALGIMAIPQTYLIISGGFDISVGSVVALTGVLIGALVDRGVNTWLAALIALTAAGLVGVVNGFIILKVKINALITTLGMLSIVSGIAYVVSNNKTLFVSDSSFAYFGTGNVIGKVPFSFVFFLMLVAVAFVVERFTRLGLIIYAIGGNREAARRAGIHVDAVPYGLYVMSALSGGVAGILVTSELGASSAGVGSTYLLSVVTAVILGGAALTGGRGTIVGTLVAALILGILQDGFALLNLSAFVQTIADGVVLIFAVTTDELARRLGLRYESRPQKSKRTENNHAGAERSAPAATKGAA